MSCFIFKHIIRAAAGLMLFLPACALGEPGEPELPSDLPPHSNASAPSPEQNSFTPAAAPQAPAPDQEQTGLPAPVPECWQKLVERLAGDGLDQIWLESVFSRLSEGFTDTPMKVKLKELYKIKFGKRRPVNQADKEKVRYLPNILTEENTQRALEFLEQHEKIFLAAEAVYGVPKEVAVSLLLVETRLGAYLGRQPCLRNLASMATSTEKETFYAYLPSVRNDPVKEAWMQDVLNKRSEWAYKELKALLQHSCLNDLDPLSLYGSVYGAIGYCQFMPTNIPVYGTDGNKDGKINLFEPADAIFSLSNFLRQHGWTPRADSAKQRKALLSYNRSSAYANTILKMADDLRKREQENAQAGTGEN